jgi:hypothetical protein
MITDDPFARGPGSLGLHGIGDEAGGALASIDTPLASRTALMGGTRKAVDDGIMYFQPPRKRSVWLRGLI